MYRCDQCGSPHVQAMAWANINTGAFVEWDEGNNRYWCEDCESAGRDPPAGRKRQLQQHRGKRAAGW